MPLVALTLDTPCYLISGLASDLTVQVRIDDKLIPLSTTQFTLVEGQCTDILVTTQEYFATASATFPSNAWGVVQQVTETDGLTVAVSDGGKGISATFYYVPVIPLAPPVVHAPSRHRHRPACHNPAYLTLRTQSNWAPDPSSCPLESTPSLSAPDPQSCPLRARCPSTAAAFRTASKTLSSNFSITSRAGPVLPPPRFFHSDKGATS
jgi:hypothetical protein